jgi:hypothetical protein
MIKILQEMPPRALIRMLPMLTRSGFRRGRTASRWLCSLGAAELELVRRCSPSAIDHAKETRHKLIALLTLAFLTTDVGRPTFYV